MRTWRRRKETLGVFSYSAKRHKSAYISVNNNTNLKKFCVLSIYTRWDGLSQKTISRYCPFKLDMKPAKKKMRHCTVCKNFICENLNDCYILLPTICFMHRFCLIQQTLYIFPNLDDCPKFSGNDTFMKIKFRSFAKDINMGIFFQLCSLFIRVPGGGWR